MSLIRTAQRGAFLTLFFVGCRSPSPSFEVQPTAAPKALIAPAAPSSPKVEPPALPITQTSFSEPAPEALPVPPPSLGNESELSLPRLIAEVEARNPSLQAMAAAWQAASERYPQAVALDDPMFMALVAPTSLGASGVQDSYMLQGSQKLPWFGKRALRGQAARAEASAAGGELQDERVRLTQMVQVAYLDYYLVRRQQDLNLRNLEIVREFRDAAEAKYRANQVTQQDLLQADVELGELERRGIELERMNRVAMARINTLLRVDPAAPLPPPARALQSPTALCEMAVLQEVATRQRPDLMALGARVAAEEAAVALAVKGYRPDVEVIGRYDNFWEESEVRPALGVNLNVPLYKGKLDAALREATHRLSQRRAEYDQRALDVQYEVASAYEQVEESRRTVTLYRERLLPAATQNVAAARANYDTSQADFLELATAQRKLIELSEKNEEVFALYHTRLAELERAVGGRPAVTQAPPPQESLKSLKTE